MSIIKSIDNNGRECTSVQPDSVTDITVTELKQSGHTHITKII